MLRSWGLLGMGVDGAGRLEYFPQCSGTCLLIVEPIDLLYTVLCVFVIYFSGSSTLLSTYRDRSDALNYIAAGGL